MTLYALLKAISLGWQEKKVSENAEKIGEMGRRLHERSS